MPRRCLVCLNPDRAAVDKALVGGTPFRNVSKRHGLSVASLFRHRKEHISAALVKAAERREEDLGDSLLAEMRTLQARTMKLLDDAEKDEDGRLRAAAIHQSRENLSLLSKLLAELRPLPGKGGPTFQITLIGGRWPDLPPLSALPPTKGSERCESGMLPGDALLLNPRPTGGSSGGGG